MGFFKRLFGKKKSDDKKESKEAGKISEWSYQRFCGFYGNRVFKDEKFFDKVNTIIDCVNERKIERLDDIASESGCTVEEVVMKIKYLKNKRVIDNVYIDRINRLIKKCTEDDSKILDRYYTMLYNDHFTIHEIAIRLPNYHNKPLPIIEEDVFKDIKYLYEKSIVNGIKLDESRREIIYYTLEKKKKREIYATVNCPKCGALVDVIKNSTGRCDYCGALVEDTTHGKY